MIRFGKTIVLSVLLALPAGLLQGCGDEAKCPGGLDCACIDGERCDDPLVCDGRRFICRDPLQCEELECIEHAVCQEASQGVDARCLEECQPGFEWKPVERICQALPADCDAGSVTSILGDCQALNRECLAYPGGAQCGDCLEGFIPDGSDGCTQAPTCDTALTEACAAAGRTCLDGSCGACLDGWITVGADCLPQTCSMADEPGALGQVCQELKRVCVETAPSGADCGDCWPEHVEQDDGSCRPAHTCSSLDCGAYNRLCVIDPLSQEAVCDACLAGFEDAGGTCLSMNGMTCDGGENSLIEACADENRECDPHGPDGAVCGDCLEGYVISPDTGNCMEPVPCDEIDCTAFSRVCDPEPTAHCTDCIEGLLEDQGGFCRPPLTCDQINCGGFECLPAPEGSFTDARCVSPCQGTDLWNGVECVSCPPCDNAEWEQGPEDRPTLAGLCICRTLPGYFFSPANESGTVPCDADGDGWVRESARVILESGDPVMIENTRCTIRSIQQIVVHNEAGQSRTVDLDEPLQLFESVRNDDDAVLRIQWERAQLPFDYWGEGQQGIRASVLNRFTKLCHDPRVDYNDNGLSDAYEWGNAEPAEDFRPEYLAFNQYSFFLELHQGWYQQGGSPEQSGSWHIQERARMPGDPAGAPLLYPEGSGTGYWQECLRRRDAEADTQDPPVGMDLALEPGILPLGPSWRGMTHHSQFKCLVIRDVTDQAHPLETTPDDALAEFNLNSCQTAGPVTEQAGNAGNPQIACQLADQLPASGSVLWGAVPYQHYPPDDQHSGYLRGCVNGCSEALYAHLLDSQDLHCPGLSANTPRCAADQDDHGKLVCLEAMCDGIDNDFDGATDEDQPDPQDTCLTGEEPSCCFTGQPGICNLGTVTGCDGNQLNCEPANAGGEACDALDNDCDGETDENLNGIPCAFESPSTGLPADPDLEGVCRDRLTLCYQGIFDCLPRHLLSYQPDGETLCDGMDNDCDGETDEELTGIAFEGEQPGVFGQACQGDEPAVGLCVTQEWKCLNGAPTCVPTDHRIVEEERCGGSSSCGWLCDGLDNDCDGENDEGDVCLRYMYRTIDYSPIALNGHNIYDPGSQVQMNIDIDFSAPMNSSEIGVSMAVGVEELCDGQCWDHNTHSWVDHPVQPVESVQGASSQVEWAPIQGKLRELVGGPKFSANYTDVNEWVDTLIDPWWPDEDLLMQITTPHPAVTTLYCRGMGEGLLTGLPEIAPYENCDRTLCNFVYERCFTGQDPYPDCRDEFYCAVDCDQYDNVCFDNCVPGFHNNDHPIGWQMACCDWYTPRPNFHETFCHVELRIEYKIWPMQNLCPGYPSAEVCDGCDNDHDGLVDEDFPTMGQPCGNDEGVCTLGGLGCAAGMEVCQGGVQPAEDEPPICNGLDDDCDGQTDEEVREPCLTSCGPGTKECGGSGCLAGDCPTLCDSPGYRACTPGTGIFGACFWPDIPEEECNGQDDNCDGQTDESFPEEGVPCGSHLGLCSQGVLTCQEGVLVCEGEVEPGVEICDGLDNDCDGPVDEIADTGGCPCSPEGAQEACGLDLGECQPGTRTCSAGTWTDCGGALWPTDEVCDGLDNDCSGDPDEAPLLGPPELGDPCGSDIGECRPGQLVCQAGGLVCGDEIPGSTEICDDLDNDCDGETDEVEDTGGCEEGSCFGAIELDPFPGVLTAVLGDTSEGIPSHQSCVSDNGAPEMIYHFRLAGPGYLTTWMHAFGWDSVLYLRRDDCMTDVPLACNDNCQGRINWSCIEQIPIQEQVDYYLFADGGNAHSGPFSLLMELSEELVPPGDPGWCEPATRLVLLNLEGDDALGEWFWIGSVLETGSTDHTMAGCAVTDSNEVVFEFWPPEDGTYTATTVFPNTYVDTVLFARTHCGDESTEFACNDNYGGDQSRIQIDLTAGAPIYIILEAKTNTVMQIALTVTRDF